ncbi:MAG: MBL fold metallo-hydrolase [Desulfovibrionaceae bacterium]
MIIRCWGARGSIPVSGATYDRYGGDTTCLEIRNADDEILIVDGGSGIRRLGNGLVRQGRLACTMLFTHVHWDHMLGVPFFKPVYMPQASIRVLGCPVKQGSMEKHLAEAMKRPYFPIPFHQLASGITFDNACSLDEPFSFGPMAISSIPLSHPNVGLGYRFEENGKRFVLLTDNELEHRHRGGATFEDYAAFAAGADVLFHDAEYTGDEYKITKTWGHSTYTRALELAMEAGVARFGLFHHNQDRGDDALDAMVDHCRAIVAARGVRMECFAVSQDTEIIL